MLFRQVLTQRVRSALPWLALSALLVHVIRRSAPEAAANGLTSSASDDALRLALSGAVFLIAGVTLPLLSFVLNWSMLGDAPALFAHRRRGFLGRWSFGGRPLEARDWGPLRSGGSRRRQARLEMSAQLVLGSLGALVLLLVSGVELHGWWVASACVWSAALSAFFFAGAAWGGRAGLLLLALLGGPWLLSARGGLPLASSSDLALAVRRLWGLVPETSDAAYLAALVAIALGAGLLGLLGQAAIPR